MGSNDRAGRSGAIALPYRAWAARRFCQAVRGSRRFLSDAAHDLPAAMHLNRSAGPFGVISYLSAAFV